MKITTEKEGLDYFPFDANFLFDLRTRRLMKIHGPELIYTYINLLANIYRNKGYYAICDEELIFVTSESTLFDEDKVLELIRKCVDVGFFDKEKFEQYGILTSNEIQKKFLFATKRRKNVSIKKDYCLEKEENTNDETSCIHDVDKNEQSKSKSKIESKIKSKKEFKEIPPLPPKGDFWRNDFEIYYSLAWQGYKSLREDRAYIEERKKFHPWVDIGLSLEKAWTEHRLTRTG